jgi:uncharacterized protein (TIGR02145 family)
MKNNYEYWWLKYFLIGMVIFTIFSCSKDENPYTVYDADGNGYYSLTIGTQEWMIQNLRTTKYNDGTKITSASDNARWGKSTTGAYCYYDNTGSNEKTYGKLYNYNAVKTGKLAPIGWHIPTSSEWMTLYNYLEENKNKYEGTYSNSVAKLLAFPYHWESSTKTGSPGNNPETNNKSGFCALPGGYRSSDGEYKDVGLIGYWWSSNVDEGTESPSIFVIMYNQSGVGFGSIFWNINDYGYSVRCIKDSIN